MLWKYRLLYYIILKMQIITCRLWTKNCKFFKQIKKGLDKAQANVYNNTCSQKKIYASVLELADRHVWGACVAWRTGSSPVTRSAWPHRTIFCSSVRFLFVYSVQGKSAVGLSYKMRVSMDSICGGLWLFSIRLCSIREKYHNHYFGNWSKLGTR